ncbi:MAG: CdaR family protein [Spirochaetes bacterium]|nr:CdaR family protein [Spirochaetota bacterium]
MKWKIKGNKKKISGQDSKNLDIKFFDRIKDTISKDFNIKIICFFLAIVTYLLIGFSQRSERTFSLNYQIEGLKDYYIISNEIPDALRVIVRDKQNILDKLTETDFNVRLDLSDINTVDTYKVGFKWDVPKSLNSFFSSIKVIPDTLYINIEEQDERLIPVQVDYIGDLQAGYEIKQIITNPKEIRIKGPKRLLANKSMHIKTEQINVEGESNSFIRYVGLVSPSKTVNIIGTDKIEVSFDIRVESAFHTWTFRRIITNNLNKQFQVEITNLPVTVRLQGPKNRMATLQREDIVLSVDCANIIYPGQYDYPVNAVLADENIKIISIKPNILQLTVKDREKEEPSNP